MSNNQMFIIIYILTIIIKFAMFYRKFGDICKLMETIEGKIKEASKKRAVKDEKQIESFAKIVLVITFVGAILYWYNLVINTPPTYSAILLQVLVYFTSFANEFTTFMLQFIYFNFCIQICSLFKQIEDDLNDLKFIYDEKLVTKMLSEVVDFHNDVHEIIVKLLSCFENVLKVNFVFNIWFVAQTTIYSVESKWLELLTSLPFLLFEAWIYCFASQKIITMVRPII